MSDEKKVVKTKRKANASTVMARTNHIQELLLLGHTRSSILQNVSSWGLDPRSIDEYMARARINIQEVNLLTLQDNLSTIVSNQWILYRAAIATKNVGLARQILMDIAKIRGLDQQTINHVVDDKRDFEDMSDDDLATLLNAPVQH